MDAARLQLKIFTATHVPSEAFIPVFHRWIKEHVLPELLIDVANYAHVPQGPGVVLIGHNGDYFMDEERGRPGLLFNRKRGAPPPSERVADLFRHTLHAAALLEAEPTLAGKLKFASNEFLFRANDRLNAPNSEATFTALRPALASFATQLFGEGNFTLSHTGEKRELFSVTIKTPTAHPLALLLDRAGGPPQT